MVHAFSLRARDQDRLHLLWPLIDHLTPREADLLREPGHLLNKLTDLCAEQHLPIAGLDRLDFTRGLDSCANYGLSPTRCRHESQIVRLATQHQIQGVDPDTIEQSITVANGTVILRDRVPSLASAE